MKSLRFGYDLTVADSSNIVRVIVFQWKPSTTLVVPTIGDIITASTTTIATLSQYVWDFKSQYTILYDRRHILSTDFPRIQVRRFINLKYAKKEVECYNATTAGSSHIYYIAISDSTAATHPVMQMYSRLTFEDA